MEGVFAAVPTAFYFDERVYLRKMEANIARYSRSPLAGILVLGSTGEVAELNDEETREVLRVAASAAAPEKVLIAGVSRESVKVTVELAEAAAAYGYDAVLVHAPTCCAQQLNSEYVARYLRCVADRSPLPVLLCNMPEYVPYNISVELVAELAQHPNIIGIKDSSGDVERIAALVQATQSAPKRTVTVTNLSEAVPGRLLAARKTESVVSADALAAGAAVSADAALPALKTRAKEVGFQVLSGYEGTLLASLEVGASGGILAFAAFAPEACQEIFSFWKEHNLQLAREKQALIAAPGRRIVGELGIAGVKYACDYNGFFGGPSRLPVLPLNAEQKSEVEALLTSVRF